MKKHQMSVSKRTLLGRKSKQLRAQKIVPGNVFGKKITSIAVQILQADLIKTYKEAGETGLVEITLDGKNYTVLISNMQKHAVTDNILHVDLHQVDLKEKIHARVPLDIVGIAPAVEQKKGLLLHLLDEIEVEALPTDLPEKISVAITNLKEVGDAIKVSDLNLDKTLTVLTKIEVEVAKIGALLTKDAEKQAAEEAAAKAAAQAQTAAATAAAPGGETAAPSTKEASVAGKPTVEAKSGEKTPSK
ncbi:MAG: 50S ribosomal protein L25 [Candidatus Curtissbacteria bacterium GW2011_GWA1_40_16]|uniref:Large ribosomal subunit protein bL25 n=1 Tax=Candidatus Curtissbacteria bacterium GW2011_GWA1_40_16 TaxID=1618405 RepID=A0A0G0R9M4_9BACT|nr:MAG: 50S ribosomal protein L25 [Candidatus Curtissbacteria bacterium GW2011_GWA1_40_16]